MRTFPQANKILILFTIVFIIAVSPGMYGQLPPDITDIPGDTISEGGEFPAINLNDFVTDPDNVLSSLSWTVSDTTYLIVSIENSLANISTKDEDWFGSDTITFTVTDPDFNSDSDTAVFKVLPVNDAPVVTDIPDRTIAEGGNFEQIRLDNYVSDVDNAVSELTWNAADYDPLGVTIDPATHVATITTPNNDWFGNRTISFTATDSETASDSDPALYTVIAVNDAPVVTDIPDRTIAEGGNFEQIRLDNYVSDVDNAVSDLTWNAADYDPLGVTIDPATHVATITTPNNDWFGNRTISFTATDPGSASDSDPTLYTVTAVNDAPVITGLTGQIILEGNEFADFNLNNAVSDVEDADNLLTWTATVQDRLNVEINDITHIASITPPNSHWNGSEIVTFTVSDTEDLSDSESATFEVTALAEAPVADDDEYDVAEGATLNVAAPGVLDGDTDGDGEPLLAVLESNPAHSTAFSLDPSGAFTYTHDGSETTEDAFTYHASDGSLESNTATVTININLANEPPTLNDLSGEYVTFIEDGPAVSFLGGLIVNDPENSTLSGATINISQNFHAGADIIAIPNNMGLTATFIGNQMNLIGVASVANYQTALRSATFRNTSQDPSTLDRTMQIRVYDGELYSDFMYKTVKVSGQNDPPVATGDAFSVAEGGTFNQAAPGVLSNDIDPEGSTLTASKVSDPANGTLTLNANGSFIYIHNGTETTTDAFTYRAYDGVSYSNTVTVNITITNVNDPPVATGDAFSVAEGGTFNQSAPGVLSNDTDPEGSTLTASKVSDPANGTLTLNANGSFIYIHNGTETTTDAFTYRAYDGVSYSNTVTVNITITNVNDPPVASALVIGGANNSIGTEQIASFAFTDPDGDGPGTHTYQWYRSNNSNGIPATAISGATSDTYVPVLADGGKFIGFEVTPRDIHGLVGTLVRIPIFKPINAAPVASNVQVDAPGTLPGQVLTALLSYADAESDPAGVHTFNWYRANSTPTPAAPGIPVGTGSTYTLKAADAGKYIWFRVSPVATTGSTPGEFVWSNNIIGPIGSFSANIAGSGTFCQGSTMNITLTITGGKSPYTAKLHRSGSISDQDTTIYNIAASPYTIQVKISGSYELKSLTDASTPTPDVAVVSSTPVILTINPKAKALLSGTYEICNDGVKQAQIPMNFTTGVSPWSVKLRRGASNDTTYTNITADPFPFNARVIGTSPTRYRIIEIRDAKGCLGDTTSGSAWVSYKLSPSATISGLDSICPGTVDSLIVELNSGTMPWSYTYLRDGSNQVIVANINTTKVKLYVNNPGIYTLAAVSDQVCTGKVSGTGTIRSYEVPTATITGTQTICQHTSGNLNVALTGHQPWRYKYRLVGVDTTELIGVTASPNVTTTKRAGTYNLLEVYDKNCKGSIFGSATISFIPAPEVELTGLAPAYDKQYNQLVPLTGTPTGTPGNSQFSGPGLILNDGKYSFFPPLANVGTNNIVYSYRATSSSCWGYDTSVVRILEANSIIEFENDRTKYCTNDQPFTIIGTNILGVTGGFSISGGIGLTDHGNNTATITPALLNPNNYTITYTYYDAGLPQPKQASFDVGVSPVADFKGATECFQSGQSVTLNNTSVSNFGFLSDTLFFWKILNKTGSGYVVNDTAENISYTFAEPGNYNISLELYNSYGCYANTSRTFTLRPTIKPAEETQFEEFETGALGWTKGSSSDSPNSWTLGDPDRGFTGPFSGENCWFTLTQGTRPPKEQSWITTPCYDFRGTEKPMLKMWVWRLFNSNRDGANVQFSADSGKTWTPLGDLNDGISWYNYTYIPGLIGDNKIGWCVHPVTNLGNDTEWKEVRHSLDILKDKPQVQFRIAYGSDGSAQNNNGIAFDNFWIGERRRTALIEHFTNSSVADCMEADSLLDAFTEDNELSVINIQYHTSNPSGDPFFEDNSVIPSTREFYYGVSDVPYALLNGGVTGQHSFDYQEGSKPLDKNAAIIESLREASFDISISSAYIGNILDVEVDIVAAKVMPMTELSVRVAVIEREIHGINGNNGDTVFRNVVKAMLPGAAGVSINKSWSVSDHQKIDLEWPVQQVYDPQQLRLVAFVQDEATYEIYQVVLDTIDGESGIFDPRPEKPLKKNFIVYPNPASQSAIVRFENELTNSTFINLYNNTGSLVYSSRIEAGNNMAEIPVADLPDGIYMLRMTVKNQLLGTSKLIISR